MYIWGFGVHRVLNMTLIFIYWGHVLPYARTSIALIQSGTQRQHCQQQQQQQQQMLMHDQLLSRFCTHDSMDPWAIQLSIIDATASHNKTAHMLMMAATTFIFRLNKCTVTATTASMPMSVRQASPRTSCQPHLMLRLLLRKQAPVMLHAMIFCFCFCFFVCFCFSFFFDSFLFFT